MTMKENLSRSRRSTEEDSSHNNAQLPLKNYPSKLSKEEQLSYLLKEICPRGNNKVVILYFLIYDKGLLFMLELYWSKT